MINKELESVAKFHSSFGIDSQEFPTVKIPEKTLTLRYNLMKEENEE